MPRCTIERVVAAHCHGKPGIMAALRAGVRTIEHGTYLDDECCDAMRETGAILVPTRTVVEDLMANIALVPDYAVAKIELVADADFSMVFPGKLPDAVMRAAKKCRLIQVLSAAYDEINLKLAKELGIPVANNGGANSVAVAEQLSSAPAAATRAPSPL